MRASIACLGFTVIAALFDASTVRAQSTQSSSSLVAPAEVVIYVPPVLKSQDFIGPLVCALKRVLVAPVNTLKIDMAFDRSMLATEWQFDVAKVAGRFTQLTAQDGGRLSFKYLLLPYDLKAPPFNYVFATSFGGPNTPYRVGVISTVRLDVNPLIEHPDGADVTALRVYKLMLKSIARLSGLASPERCILVFPRSLVELDQKPAEFCPEDHDALVAAGILKAEERDTGDCIVVSQRRFRSRLADSRVTD